MGRFASLLLLFNAFFVILVTIYKFTNKRIAPLFFLQTVSHYSFYLAFCVLVKCTENTKVKEAGGTVLRKTWTVHIWYIFLLYFGYCEASGCVRKAPYPFSFMLGCGMFILTYSALCKLSDEVLIKCWNRD